MARQRKTRSHGNDARAEAIPDSIQELNRRGQLARKAGTAEVAIFWLLNGNLLLDNIPWTEGEHIGDFVNHPRSHEQQWRTYQRAGAAPRDAEYEEFPRGRIVFSLQEPKFKVFADRCILRDKKVRNRIISECNLPSKTTIFVPDPHYRCWKCLNGKDL